MNQVMKLLDRVVEALRSEGVEPYFINGSHEGHKIGDRPLGIQLSVEQTVRMNHNYLENVTVTIEVVDWGDENNLWGHRIAKVKVPKDASDKVINNRIKKILDLM